MESECESITLWFEKNRKTLSDFGLWFLGNEPNSQSACEFATSDFRLLIARLSTYRDVSSGITHTYLWQLARQVKGVFADFAFLPPARDEKRLVKDGIPFLTGITSKQPPQKFDLIAISNCVVQELINLPAMLYHSGIALSRKAREDNAQPMIILGGSNSYATEILHGITGGGCEGEGLVDCVLIGDGEKSFPKIIRLMKENRHLSRNELLRLLADNVDGFYDPEAYRRLFDRKGRKNSVDSSSFDFPAVKAARIDPDDLENMFTGGPIPYFEHAAGTSQLLVSNGCPFFCSFCKESWEQKPYRERSVSKCLSDARLLKASMGITEINLSSFNVNTLSSLPELLSALGRIFERVAIKSQRFDGVAFAPELLKYQIEAGKRTFTCAMEGISDRIRRILQKNLDNRTVMTGFSRLFGADIRQMKVFMIITGWEQTADYDEFSGLLAELKTMLRNKRQKPLITFSFACLFRPPMTPMQYMYRKIQPGDMEKALETVMQIAAKAGFETRISAGAYDAMVSEFLAYADRRVTKILVEASILKGFRYHGEIDDKIFDFFRRRLDNESIELANVHFEASSETVFPWSHIDSGISERFIFENHQVLKSGSENRSCIPEPFGTGRCLGCSACDTSARKEFVTGLRHALSRAYAVESGTTKLKPHRYHLEAYIPRIWCDCPDGFIFAALARLIMLRLPETIDHVKDFEPTMDRQGAFGYFTTDLIVDSSEFGKIVQNAADSGIFEQDECGLRIIAIRPAGNTELVTHPMMVYKLHALETRDLREISGAIDAMLTRYRFKHRKYRVGQVMLWELAPGYAKKSGIKKIELDERSGQVIFSIIKHPEKHFFRMPGFLSDIEILLP